MAHEPGPAAGSSDGRSSALYDTESTDVGDEDALIADACAEVVDDFLEQRLDALFARAREQFFVRARDAADADEEARHMALVEEVDSLAPAVCQAFESTLRVRLASLSVGEVVLPTLKSPDAGGGGDDDALELMATRKLDDWVRFTSIIRRHHAAIGDAQRALQQRLSELTGTPINDDNNPLGVTGICALFHDALLGVQLSRDLRSAVFEAFESEIVEQLEPLMAGLDERLRNPPAPELDDALVTTAPRESEPAPETKPETKLETTPDAPSAQPSSAATDTAVSSERLRAMLIRLGRDARARGDEDALDADAIAAWLRESVPQPLDANSEQTVDALQRVLVASLTDDALDPAVRMRIARLAVPVLSLAAGDGEHADTEVDAARHDPVTGLQDQAAFLDRLERTLELSEARSTSVCLIRVDGLSEVRREAGAQIAGRVLRLLAAQLLKHAGSTGSVARLSGDTLAVMLEGFGRGWAKRFAQRLLKTLRQSSFQHAGGKLDVRFSIGVAGARGDALDAQKLMQRALAALEQASRAGGNRICVTRDPKSRR